MRATSTFDIGSWDQQPYDERATEEGGAALSRTRITKVFHGDIDGTSTTEALMAMGGVEGSAGYVAMERISGTVNGRSGSFVLQHSASADRGAQSASWSIVPDSGTAELAGPSGSAEIINEPDGGHTFILDYELAEPPAETPATPG